MHGWVIIQRDGARPAVDVRMNKDPAASEQRHRFLGEAEQDFRSVLGHFATGVAVVTAMDGLDPVGMTVQSFCSLSLEPPLILLCPARTSTSWPRIQAGRKLCVNLLAQDSELLARQFAKSGSNKFEGVSWSRSTTTGCPILAGGLAWIDCEIEETHPGGDHFVVICNVLALGARTGLKPLIFFKSGFERVFSPQKEPSPPPALQQRILDHGTDRISYLEAGTGDTIMFLHSLGTDAHLWEPQLRTFGRTHHVVAIDLRGHGESSWESRLTPALMVEDVTVLARRLGLEGIVLVGLSMGANVALLATVSNPGLARGLVLASAFTHPSPVLRDVLLGMADEAEKVVDMSQYAQRRAERMLPKAPEASRDAFFSGAQKMSKLALVSLGRALADWNVTPLLHSVTIPSLVVVGERDPYVSPAMATELATQLTASRVRVLAGAGHICNADMPAAFNRALRRFLAELPDPRLSPPLR
jgi:3-hydroxy-9,10-secoandrosta-1,3,5(10)-triene-9,17-dione monooxygenase reductase component